jgi:hypothetical protein
MSGFAIGDIVEDISRAEERDSTKEETVGTGRLDLLRGAAEVLGLGIDGAVGRDLQPKLPSKALDLLGDPDPERLGAMEDVSLVAARLLHQRDERPRLDVIRRDDASIRPFAGRVVLVGLTLHGTGGTGETDGSIRWGDLEDRGAVEDRDREPRGR